MKQISPTYCIEAGLFRLKMEEGDTANFSLRTQKGNGAKGQPSCVTIIYPKETDFQDSRMQEWLHKVITESMRKQAHLLLPPRLRMHANNLGLTFNRIAIKQNRSNWGSCARHRTSLLGESHHNINLSLYLLLLPLHLIDYVLRHELAHIHEMNHSARFWDLLSVYTDTNAKALRTELRNYHIDY